MFLALMLVSLLFITVIVNLLLILPVFILNILLKKFHYLYSLLLLIYPVLIYFFSQLLRKKGEELNIADQESFLTADGDWVICLSYIFVIALAPVIFTCIFLIIKTILRQKKWI